MIELECTCISLPPSLPRRVSDMNRLDAVVEPGALRGEDEFVRPQRVHDSRGDEGPGFAAAGIEKKMDQRSAARVR